MEKLQREKKSSSLIFLVVLMIAALFCTPAFSWLMQGYATNISVTANIIGSYFEQGIGTEDRPYVIAKPIQLYYFAWLQNLGFFNGPEGNKQSTTEDKKFYFTLGADIDLAGNEDFSYVPPVGTVDYPFIGVFNGLYHYVPAQGETDKCATEQGKYHVISNVTITNKDSDLNNIPEGGNEATAMQYVGLFGVVGSMSDPNVKGEIKNFALNNVTVETKDPTDGKTIIGIVAAYLNGDVSGIGVSGCTVSVASSVNPAPLGDGSSPDTLSFSLIGYSDKTYEAYGFSPMSGGSDFGGSLAMKDMYDDILNARDTGTTVKYYSQRTITIDPQGNRTEEFTESNYRYNSSRYYELVNNQVLDDQGYITQSYGAIKRYKDSSFDETVDDFMYLVGGLTANVTQRVTTITQTIVDAFTIGDGNGNFIVGGTGTPSNATNIANATAWRFSNGASGGTISIQVDGTTYYLRNNNGTLQMSTTSTTWTISNDGKISNNNYYLCFDDGTWKLKLNDVDYTISNGSGRYLNYSSGITSGTTASTRWVVDANNRIYTQSGSTKYYLRNNNGSLTTTTTASSGAVWEITNNQQLKTGIYYLSYSSNSWTLAAAATSMTIKSGNYYLRYNGSIGRNRSTSTQWYVDNGKIFAIYNGSPVYLRRNNTTLTTTSNVNDATTWTVSNNTISNGGYYIYYTSRSPYWGLQTSSYTLTLATTNYDIDNEVTAYYYDIENVTTPTTTIWESRSNTNQTVQVHNDPTFIPLTINDDGSTSRRNTGYIVSGANYNESGQYPGDIRVSSYAMSNLYVALNGTDESASYNGRENGANNLEVLTRTFNTEGYFRRITDDYNSSHNSVNSNISGYTAKTLAELGLDKYAASRAQLHTTLSGDSNIYGLHFMDAQISVNNKVKVGKATINGRDYFGDDGLGYELPQDCIDFNLKSRGFVNFFAGTYFGVGYASENDTFFSLHHIIRTGQSISQIKEISQIYGKLTDAGLIDTSVQYIYVYKDGTYSAASIDGYTEIFNTSWITAPTSNNSSHWVNNAMYYFEIPVNEGEYALGSVSGRNGAYLIYLDIGASSNGAGDGTTLETSIKGIDFVTAASIADSTALATTLASITDQTNADAVVVLKNGFTGSITFVKTVVDDHVTISYTLSNVSAKVHVDSTTVDPVNIEVVWANDPDPDPDPGS